MSRPWALRRCLVALVASAAVGACKSEDSQSPSNSYGTDASADAKGSSEGGAQGMAFPKGFLFGTAIAGFQADMGCPTLGHDTCDDPNSDWHAFTTDPTMQTDTSNHLSGQDPTVVGPGFWELYEQDLTRAAQELKNNSFRMSIEWSRVFPAATDGATTQAELRALANPKALATYHAMFASMRAHNLKPLVTLNHYALPTWIHDAVACHRSLTTCTNKGWLDRERVVREIAKYAGFVAEEFGGEVDLWATLNEPMAVVFPGYIAPDDGRSNPPAVSFQGAAARTAISAMIEAHARMYDAVKKYDTKSAESGAPPSSVGVVFNVTPMVAKDPSNPLDVQAAENLFYLWNLAFLNGFCKGDIDEDLDGTSVHRADLEGKSDYLGVNFYNQWTVVGGAAPILPDFSVKTTFTANGIDTSIIYPRGMYEVAMFTKNTYHLPVYITENGTGHADHPEIFEGYLTDHLRWLLRASAEGADVRGYFYWTLMDNFEWNHGMLPRLGLYSVKTDDAAKTRTARPSAATYAAIAGSGEIPKEFLARHPEGDAGP